MWHPAEDAEGTKGVWMGRGPEAGARVGPWKGVAESVQRGATPEDPEGGSGVSISWPSPAQAVRGLARVTRLFRGRCLWLPGGIHTGAKALAGAGQ